MTKKTGSCLCGAVAVAVEVEKAVFDACHCGMCRTWGGGPALTVDASKGLEITGTEHVTTYDSSAWAERGFCKRCGTHLFYKLKGTSYCNVTLGLLDDVDELRFQLQIYTDNKPRCYAFANVTEMMTEAEVLAKFGPAPG